MKYFLSLGSNVGDRVANLRNACSLLEKTHIHIVKSSSIYETEPVDYQGQPWFLNLVIEVETGLSPLDLLDAVKKIENQLGRKNLIPKGPRKIDLDIILAGESILKTPRLVIPHPRLHKRKFVLIPLREIAPQVLHPVSEKTIATLAEEILDFSIVRRYQVESL